MKTSKVGSTAWETCFPANESNKFIDTINEIGEIKENEKTPLWSDMLAPHQSTK